MEVRIRLYATLRKYHPAAADPSSNHGFSLALESGATIRHVLEDSLGIPRQTVKMMFVNGIARDDDYLLHDGDEVGIFPPVAGGVVWQ